MIGKERSVFMMKLKDIVKHKKFNYIEYRKIEKDFLGYEGNYEDIFIGCAKFDGINLVSLDGDIYSLEDNIEDYKIKCEKDKIILTVWIDSDSEKN